MDIVKELRKDAIRARDEHGNTDFYHTLGQAADEIERLRAFLTEAADVIEDKPALEAFAAEFAVKWRKAATK